MKIGFLAMSGVRAHDPALTRLGLTLPGFVERGRTIASLPSLGLLYLAACTPAGHELRYFEAESDRTEPAEIYTCDLVAISTFTAQVFEAYAIADRLRAAGVKVAMGGLHVSVRPDEAARHADYVILGEGENVWSAVVAAAEEEFNHQDTKGTKRLSLASDSTARARDMDLDLEGTAWCPSCLGVSTSRVFSSHDFPPVDGARLPVPRYDLLRDVRPYNRLTVQTSRGCPWRCDFCASTVMLGRPYRKRPVEHVARDIRAIQQIWPEPFIEFADDNTFVDKAWGKRLCEAIAPLGVKWFTETDVTVADDVELLDAMRDAGCRQVLIGLESPGAQGLDGIELRANVKARWANRYADAVRTIQSRGITVNGCFVLGLDGHTTRVFDDVLRFATEVGLYDVQVTVMTPFPGTPLYERLAKAGRIIERGRWDLCTLFDVNFHPLDMTADELRQGIVRLAETLYSDACTRQRRRTFFEMSRSARILA